MTIYINPYSGAGRALEKWSNVRAQVERLYGSVTEHIIEERDQWNTVVRESLAGGERQFVAAGGDGTVNILLNTLLANATDRERPEFALGAIGLGSSNDFHKPVNPEGVIGGIPCKLDFDRSAPRDVGVVFFQNNGMRETRYFMVNASIGVTASANYFFNHPDALLRRLKKYSVSAAIYYSAFLTIIRHKNIPVLMQVGAGRVINSRLSNLAVIKNPNFSGSLHYGIEARYQSHDFDVFSCHGMGTTDLLRLLYHCANGGATTMENMDHWILPSLSVKAGSEYALEYDGEVVQTDFCRFSVFPTSIRVCP